MIKIRELLFIITLFIIALPALTACGFTGGTRSLVVEPVSLDDKTLQRKVVLESFTVEDNATFRFIPGRPLLTTGAGAFDEEDRLNFESSLKNSLNTVNWETKENIKEKLALKVILRRHVLAAGSVQIVTLGVYRYAIFDADNNKLYEEQFYATDSNYDSTFQTLGRVKDGLNERALKRILNHSVAIASGVEPKELPPVDGTYDSMQQLAPQLETRFGLLPIITHQNSSEPVPGLKIPSRTKISGGESGSIRWERFDRTEPIEW